MADDDTLKNHPSLPSNYVSLAQLQEQWLKRKQKQKEEEEEEAAAKRKESKVQENQEFAEEGQNKQYQQHQKQGNCAKNYKNMEKLNLCSVQESDKKQFQQQQKQGNCVKNNKNFEILNLGSVKYNRNMEKSNAGNVQESDQQNGQYKHEQELGGCVKDNRNMEKLNFGRVQESGRNGYKNSVSYDRNYEKGVYKDKGKEKIGEVGERQFDSVLHWLEESGDFDGCDAMCACVVEMKEDEIVEVKKPEDRFEGGLKGNGSDLRTHYDMGVATDVKNEEQRRRKGYKNRWSKKGVSNGKCGNGGGVAEEIGIQTDLKKKNGEENGEGSGKDIGGGESVAEKVVRLKERRHKSASVGRKKINGRVMESTREVDKKWAVEGVMKVANIKKNIVGEKSPITESVEEIPTLESETVAKADSYTNGSQRNYCDHMLNSEFCDKTMERIENQKQELSIEEAEDNGLLMTKEANGESDTVRGKNRGNWNKRGFSREKIRRDFEELSLNIRRVGNGRNNVRYNQNWRFQDSRFSDKHRNGGLVWVKKEDTLP